MNSENKNIVSVTNELHNSVIVEYNPSELPLIVSKQVQKMTALEQEIKRVMKEAEKAKKAAQNANTKITIFSGRKEAIEELQSSGRSLASAVQVNAEALKLSFEFQKQLAEISKFLFGLGVSNIAQNRIVVQELELRLKDASQEEIDDLKNQEIATVVRQLKAQADLLYKQEQFNKRLKDFDKELNIISDNNKNLEKNVISLEETDKRHDKKLAKLEETDKRHDKKLAMQVETDKRHDEELAKQKEVDKRHDEELAKRKEADKRHDEELAKRKEADKRHDEELAKQKEVDKRHDEELAKRKEVDKRHDEELAKRKEADKRHDEELSKQKETEKRQNSELQEQKVIIKHQELLIDQLMNQIKRLNLKTNFVLFGFVLAILILILLRYFFNN